MSGAPVLLRTQGLTKRYPEVTAVDGLDVEVPAGRVGLVGANGAGKTTLFRMMLGLSHPTEGSLEVCGIDVGKDPIGARGRLGYMSWTAGDSGAVRSAARRTGAIDS